MTRVSEFKIKNFFCLFWRGELESVNFFSQTTNNPNKKKKKKFFFWGGAGVGGGGVVGGGVRWMDSPTGPNQFAPSTSSKLGA